MNARVWMIDGGGTENTIPLPIKNWITIRLAKTPQKRDDPRQGGEEAEVVVYQPRGVGLMHTRHKPSNAHYTHASLDQRKYRIGNNAVKTSKFNSLRHVS